MEILNSIVSDFSYSNKSFVIIGIKLLILSDNVYPLCLYLINLFNRLIFNVSLVVCKSGHIVLS